MPPAFKWVEAKDFVIFNYKLYDHNAGIWFMQGDDTRYLFEDQEINCINTTISTELYLMNRMKVPFSENHMLRFMTNENGITTSYYNYKHERGYMNPGKALKQLPWLTPQDDSTIERMVNDIKAQLDPDVNFKIVSGDEIKYWYLGDRYAEKSGSLSSSCMRYTRCQEYLGIYTENPIEMLIATDNSGELRGRALLWPKSMWNKNYWDDVPYIMDRIYGNDHIITKFKKYAQENNWVYKNRQTFSETQTWRVPGSYEVEEKRCRMNLKNSSFDEYPYMDTFNRLDEYDDCLKNHGSGTILDSTEGYYRDEPCCNSCGNVYNEDDSHLIDDEHYCDECAVYSEYSDISILRDECRYSEVLGSYIHDDDAVEITHGNYRNDFTHYSEIVEVYNNNTIVVPECDVTTSNAPVPFICDDNLLRINFINNVGNSYYLIASLSDRYNSRCWENFMLDVYSNIRSSQEASNLDACIKEVVIKTNNDEVVVTINDNWSETLHETMCAIVENYPANFESLTI